MQAIQSRTEQSRTKGFTLLEILVVIAILAILAVFTILLLNPAETLRKGRDTQRISDLSTIKTAIGLYLTNATSTDLDTAVANLCFTTGNVSATISYGLSTMGVCAGARPSTGTDVTATSDLNSADWCYAPSSANLAKIDGTGWVPVNFRVIPGGAPLSNLPIDPTNSVASLTAPTRTDLLFRYACQNQAAAPASSFQFELNARLESDFYGPAGTDDKSEDDGGDDNLMFEVGSSLRLIGGSGGGY